MCNCNKINTCTEVVYATCVKYEGTLPSFSSLIDDCDVTVEETITELYTLVNQGGQTLTYEAGDGLNLNTNVFSVKFGTVGGTVMEGNWRPTWEQVTGKPDIPEQVNLIPGTNINIQGTYPNLTINSSGSSGQENVIERIRISTEELPISSKTVSIPIATERALGVVRVGSGINITQDGTLSVTGTGQPNIIESVILGNTAASIVNKTVTVPIASTQRLGIFKVGTNLSITADGTLNASGGTAPQYVAGSGISISGNTITNISPNVNHTGDVTGSTTLQISEGVVDNTKLSKMPENSIKANLNPTEDYPQDVTLETLREVLGLTNQTLILEAIGVNTFQTSLKLHTAIFLNDRFVTSLVFPEGDFDGQFLSIYSNTSDTSITFSGSFIISSGGEFNAVNEIKHTDQVTEHFYWSAERSAWMAGN